MYRRLSSSSPVADEEFWLDEESSTYIGIKIAVYRHSPFKLLVLLHQIYTNFYFGNFLRNDNLSLSFVRVSKSIRKWKWSRKININFRIWIFCLLFDMMCIQWYCHFWAESLKGPKIKWVESLKEPKNPNCPKNVLIKFQYLLTDFSVNIDFGSSSRRRTDTPL
jgi:hypothetical protein